MSGEHDALDRQRAIEPPSMLPFLKSAPQPRSPTSSLMVNRLWLGKLRICTAQLRLMT